MFSAFRRSGCLYDGFCPGTLIGIAKQMRKSAVMWFWLDKDEMVTEGSVSDDEFLEATRPSPC
jgi:hypothetical protein